MGWNPYLCSWLQQICCAKLTLRIYWLVFVVRQFRNFSTILWWVQVNFQWEDGEVRLHWIGFFHSASSLKQQSAGRPIASIGHIILIPSQRSHVKVVHQLKIHKKTCFYFLVQYTRKCINSTHLSHKPIQLCVIYSKWKKNTLGINHRGHVVTLKRK
jgi:hypothetical protein